MTRAHVGFLTALLLLTGCGDDEVTTFTLRLENVSTGMTLLSSTADPQAVPISPGVFVIHTEPAPLFDSGLPDRGEGLEAVAEDGTPTMLAMILGGREGQMGIATSGAITTPVGAAGPGPIGPGGAYEVTFDAAPGDRLSFAVMFVPSNDFFFAPAEGGVALFNGNDPVSGDVTSQAALLWDAGTEADEEPGTGANQVQRQGDPNTGPADPNNLVRPAADTFGNLPAANQVIRVTLMPQ